MAKQGRSGSCLAQPKVKRALLSPRASPQAHQAAARHPRLASPRSCLPSPCLPSPLPPRPRSAPPGWSEAGERGEGEGRAGSGERGAGWSDAVCRRGRAEGGRWRRFAAPHRGCQQPRRRGAALEPSAPPPRLCVLCLRGRDRFAFRLAYSTVDSFTRFLNKMRSQMKMR